MAAHDDGLQTIETTVRTAGVSRDVSSASFESEIPSTGIASLPAGGSFTASTGTLTLEDPGTAIEVRRGSPWFRDRGWPPALGDPVEVDVDVDGTSSRRFAGIVEEAAGAATEPVEARIVGNVDQLHRRVTFEALARPMAVEINNDVGRLVDPWITHLHTVTATLRACGYHHTPRPNPQADLFVPMSGSLLPDIGRLYTAAPAQLNAAWERTPWGVGLRRIDAEWKTSLAGARAARNNFDFVAYVARYGVGTTTLELRRDEGSQSGTLAVVTLTFPTTTTMRVRVSWGGTDFVDQTVTYRPDYPYVRVRVVPRGATLDSDVTVWHGGHLIYSGVQTLNNAWEFSDVRVATATGAILGSIYLARGDLLTGPAADMSSVNARLLASPIIGAAELDAIPYLETRDALDLLREIAAATLSDMWIDREGVLTWAGVGALAAQPTARTLTAEADLLNLAWEESVSSQAREVIVRSKSAAVSSAARPRVVLWEPTSVVELSSTGDTEDVWVTAPDGQDWLDPRDPVRYTSGTPPTTSSVYGATRVVTGTTPSESWATTSYLSASVTKINSQAYKIAHTARTLSSTNTLELRVPSTVTPATLAGKPLPRLLGFGRVDWADVTRVAAKRGPSHAADYEHDARHWVQNAGDTLALANWIADWTTKPGPVLRELPIVYRPDVALGEVVEVVEDAVYHVRVRAVVVGLRESHDDGSSDMSVTLRVLSLSQQPATLDTYDQVWAGGTLAQRDAEWSGQTLAQFDANPLRRS